MSDLAATAALGNLAVQDLVGVAVWAFASQDEQFKQFYVREVSFARRPGPPGARRPSLKEKLHDLARRILSAFG
jgi:hypothetical protein